MIRLLTAALFLCGGCHWDLHDPGTDPPPAQFYFPAGLAIDPSGQWLYVSNGNADLRFSGGSVQLVDIHQFECDLQLRSCADPQAPECQPTPFDSTCGDLTAVKNHYGDAGCQPDPLNPSVVDCNETRFIEDQATVKVGNFAGTIRLLPTGTNTRRLFVGVRGDPSVTRIDVDLTEPNKRGTLNCFDPLVDPATIKGNPPNCGSVSLVQTYPCVGPDGVNTCTQNQMATKNQFPEEPFGMALDPGASRLLVSSLSTGQVTLIDAQLGHAEQNAIRNVSASFFTPDSAKRHGAFALAQQQPNDPNSLWYLTSNIQPEVATFRVAEDNVIVPSITFPLSGPLLSGSDGRDLAFEPGGNRLFLTDNNPPVLLVIDTSSPPSSPNPGQPRNQVVDIVDICQSPSHMGVRRALVPGAFSSPPLEETRIYVACFASDQVMVVDPDRPGVDSIIDVGRGPNDITFNFGEGLPEPLHRRAYVTFYSEWTVGVIDLDPGSPTENRLIGRIGLPFVRTP